MLIGEIVKDLEMDQRVTSCVFGGEQGIVLHTLQGYLILRVP